MSIEAHPNINAVGLMMDIQRSILEHRRGEALKLSSARIIQLAEKFAIEIDLELDRLTEKC